MNGCRLSHHLYGVISMLAALIFYSNFRDITLLSGYLNLFHVQYFSDLNLPAVFLNHLPSFLQCVFIGYCALFTVKNSRFKPLQVGLISFVLASLIEGLQLTPFLTGTFDSLDILAIALASVINICVALSLNTSTAQTTFKPLLMSAVFSGSYLVSMGCILINDCDQDLYTCVDPVTLTWEELRADIQPSYGNETTLTSPGKIHVKGNYLFIIDRYRGVHIFDNSDSLNPMRLVFIPVIGALDLSIQGDYVYINSFTDLVIINYQMILDGSFEQSHVSRKEHIFKPPLYSTFYPEGYAIAGKYDRYEDFIYSQYYRNVEPEDKGIIIGYYDTDGTKVLFGEYEIEPAPQEIGVNP